MLKNKKVLLAILSTGVMCFCGVLVETAMNVTFPALMKEFAISTSTVQWVTTIYLLIISIIVPISSFLKRNFTNKTLFSIANILFILGLLLDVFAQNFPLLLLGRAIQGLATGIALPLMFNIIIEQAPKEKLGAMMGLGTLTSAIAPALGPIFGGFISTYLSWRYIYVFLIPILILIFPIGISSIEQKTKLDKHPLDLMGMSCIIFMFTGFIYSFSVVGDVGFTNFNFLIPLFIGIISCSLFIKRMHKRENPIINLEVLKNKKFNYLLIVLFVFQTLLLGFSFVIPNFIQIVNGGTSLTAGLVMAPGALIGAILAPISGKILDRIGYKKPILTGTFISSVVLFIYLSVLIGASTTKITILQFFFMVGLGMAFSNTMTTALNKLPKNHKVDGNALINTLQQFSGAIATSIVATIISFVQNSNSNKSYEYLTALGSKYSLIYLFIMLCIALYLLLISFKNEK